MKSVYTGKCHYHCALDVNGDAVICSNVWQKSDMCG